MPAGEIENLVVMILFRLHLSWHFLFEAEVFSFQNTCIPAIRYIFSRLKEPEKGYRFYRG
jgi:hypothetical protein